jgi:hypothetical protein
VRALFDVSTLLALFDKGHMFHARAHEWWDTNVASGWATCPITQNGFVRILSQPGYSSPRALPDAIAALSLGMIQLGHAFWADDISITDPELFDHSRILGPNRITDVYLLGLAVRNGGRLVTFDAGVPVAAVKGATKAHVVAL